MNFDVDPESGSKEKSRLLVNFIFPFISDWNKDEKDVVALLVKFIIHIFISIYEISFFVIDEHWSRMSGQQTIELKANCLVLERHL